MNGPRPDDDRLRDALSELADGESSERSDVDPDRVWSAVRGEASPEQARRLADEVLRSPRLGREVRLAAEISRELDRAEPALRGSASRPSRWWWWAAAAALVVAVALPLFVLERSEPPVFRDTAAPQIESLIPDRQPLARDECVLRWSPGPEGTSYSLEIATVERGVIANVSGLEDAEYRVPASTLADVQPGAELFWRVHATALDGGVTSSITFVNPVD